MVDPPEDTQARPDIGPRDVLYFSLWFGLFTGIGSAGLIGVQKFVLDDVTLSSPQMVWTAPLMLLVLYLPIAGLLILLLRVVARRHRVRALVFALSLISCLVGLMVWGKQLADIAIAILSLGIALQLSALAARRWGLFRRIARTTFPAGIAIVLLAAMVVNVGGPLRERYRVAALPAAPEGAPNVLFIILDTVRALNLGLYGYERPTSPNLERIARSGTTFDYAIAPASWTLPAHASMFTGRPAHELTADWTERLDAAAPTLAEHFRDRGYRTGGIVANWFYANSEWGIDRGFIHYSDFTSSLGHALASTSLSNKLLQWMERQWEDRFWFHRLGGRRIAPDISRDLVSWLERDRDRPFFAFVNYYDAHDPYVAPAAFAERFAAMPRPEVPPIRAQREGVVHDAPTDQRENTLRHLDLYDAAIAYLDDQIGRLFAQLEEGGFLDNTIIVIASDHGEEFGENGHYWHGLSLHGPSVHVPLIIRFPPSVPAGRRIRSTVTLTDLAATIASLAQPAARSAFPGESLARFWEGTGSAEPVLASLRLRSPRPHNREAELRSIFTDELHYTLSDIGVESLFRYREDPLEQHDLMQSEPGAVPVLRGYLETGDSWVRTALRVDSGRAAHR